MVLAEFFLLFTFVRTVARFSGLFLNKNSQRLFYEPSLAQRHRGPAHRQESTSFFRSPQVVEPVAPDAPVPAIVAPVCPPPNKHINPILAELCASVCIPLFPDLQLGFLGFID